MFVFTVLSGRTAEPSRRKTWCYINCSVRQNRRAKLKRDMEELKKDVESAKVLTAHKSFLEKVHNLGVLKKKAPPIDKLPDKWAAHCDTTKYPPGYAPVSADTKLSTKKRAISCSFSAATKIFLQFSISNWPREKYIRYDIKLNFFSIYGTRPKTAMPLRISKINVK